MTLSPTTTSKQPIKLRNGGNGNASDTVTVKLSNAPAGATFTVAELGTPTHLTITVSGNTITITSIEGTGNRGNFTVRVTPSGGCGSAQDINVSVAK
jgi:hypothetical protein